MMSSTIQVRNKKSNPYVALTEYELLERLEKSREHASQEMCRDAAEVSRDMKAKYGL